MIYGGSLSSRRIRSRDDVSVEFCDMDLDHRLPTSARGRGDAMSASRLEELGILPGRYTGVEQVYAAGGSCLAPAVDPATCEIKADSALHVPSRSTGEVTTFAWAGDRWRWSPYSGMTIEATPRRMGAITVIDFVSRERSKQTALARLSVALDRRF